MSAFSTEIMILYGFPVFTPKQQYPNAVKVYIIQPQGISTVIDQSGFQSETCHSNILMQLAEEKNSKKSQ